MGGPPCMEPAGAEARKRKCSNASGSWGLTTDMLGTTRTISEPKPCRKHSQPRSRRCWGAATGSSGVRLEGWTCRSILRRRSSFKVRVTSRFGFVYDPLVDHYGGPQDRDQACSHWPKRGGTRDGLAVLGQTGRFHPAFRFWIFRCIGAWHLCRKRRRTRLKPLITAVLVLIVTASIATAADAHAGQAIYEKSCKACHGNDGQGNPGLAKAMSVTIPDLRSSEVQSKTDAQLKKVIAEGKGKMRPVASVSVDQTQDIIAYIRTLAKK